MTLKQFNDQVWNANTKIIYKNDLYFIKGVNFDTKEVLILTGMENYSTHVWILCTKIRIED